MKTYTFEQACEVIRQELENNIEKLRADSNSRWPDERFPETMNLDDWKQHLDLAI